MSVQSRKFMSKRNRACDLCRSKKSACRIDSAPPCYLCTLHRKECTFVEQTNRRKKRIQSSTETQEEDDFLSGAANRRPAISTDNDSLSFNSLMPIDTSILPHLPDTPSELGYFFHEDGPTSDLFGGYPRPTGFTPNSFLYPSPDLILPQSTANKKQENQSNDRTLDSTDMVPGYLGSSGDMDPLLLQHYRYDRAGKFHFKSLDIQSVHTEGIPIQFLLCPPSIFGTSREETGCEDWSPDSKRRELEAIVPEEIGKRLIALFQRIIIPYYPVLSFSNSLEPGKTPTHLLAAIYLLAEPFANFDERLAIELAYEKPSVKTILNLISNVLTYEIYMPTISTVQTLLLLLIRPSANPIVQDSSFKWTQLSTLIGCSHSLGLHLDPRSWRIPDWEISQRRRLSCCIYMIDKWLALTLGRPPFLNSETWSVKTLDAEDSLGSGLGSEQWLSFMKRIELESLLDPLIKLYSTKTMEASPSGYKEILIISEPLVHKITSWRQTVQLNTTSPPLSTGQTTHKSIDRVGEMQYLYIYLSIIRARLRSFVHLPNDENQDQEYIVARSELRSQAKACISDLTEFMHGLGSNDREVLWPAWSATMVSTICFQILLMAISSLDADEASYHWDYLQRVRRDMRLQADALPHLRLGLLRIDSIFWKGIDSVFRLDDHVRQAYVETKG